MRKNSVIGNTTSSHVGEAEIRVKKTEKLGIRPIVKECAEGVVKNYQLCKEDHLTEGDVTSHLFCMLRDSMKEHGIKGLKIHRELRPYMEGKDECRVIKLGKNGARWAPQERKNSGSVVDIVIVSSEQEYFNRAKSISPEKYWRILTYPLEAFVVCIEVKIRVAGNVRRIGDDIEKLRLIRDTLKERGKECLVQLVVTDREAPYDNRKTIEEHCRNSSVSLSMT